MKVWLAGWIFLMALRPLAGASELAAPNPNAAAIAALEAELPRLQSRLANLTSTNPDLAADAGVFAKAVTWALRYEPKLGSNEIVRLRRALDRGTQRADALANQQAPWSTRRGRVLRGFVSRVDGSIQPYGVLVPAGYDDQRPVRLDVVLHGSSQPVGLSELNFGARFDDATGDVGPGTGPDVDYLEVHPLGRVENCYRWAGETDVFEAIEAVCRNYRIDRDRIVLRGMSMGASGTWHLGLKHPDRFVAIGPYCGYVDTHRFSETPIPGFIRVGPLPPHQELGLHLLDSVDYAANAGMVPAIAAIGDQDVFFQAHVIMGAALAREGLPMINLISPGTGHVIDPVTHREQLRRLGEHAAAGRDPQPRHLRFVTWTLKYNRCHWLEVLALQEHYARTEFIADVADDGSVDIQETGNIRQFALHPPILSAADAKLRIGGREVRLPRRPAGTAARALILTRHNAHWRCTLADNAPARTDKRPGLPGPIDDAFTAPFLCVRGTGRPWNPAIGTWADATLRRFTYEWARYMRGDLPVKNDFEVTDEDIRTRHLVLFGDPGSNRWIRQALPRLPLTWTRNQVTLGGRRESSTDHVPALICASPLPGAGEHYLVLNSGHTFHEAEFAAFNYLLFPRLGDWALLQARPGAELWQPGMRDFPEEVRAAGYFDETWRHARRLPR